MSSRPSSTKLRREVFDANKWTCSLTGRVMLTCHICGLPIDPVRENWDAEHIIRRVLSNDDSLENVKPAHAGECHKVKSATDIREHAKGRRTRDKHFKIERKRKKQWSMPGWKYNWATGRKEKIGADE